MSRNSAAFALALVACGSDDPVAPSAPVLDTSAHAEDVHTWGNAVGADAIQWRLISVDANGVRGSYSVRWTNAAASDVEISYELRFYDAGGFERDRYPRLFVLEQGVAAGEFRIATGTFTLYDTQTIEAANEVERMEVWASFVFQ